jgi:hypothetical protein
MQEYVALTTDMWEERKSMLQACRRDVLKYCGINDNSSSSINTTTTTTTNNNNNNNKSNTTSSGRPQARAAAEELVRMLMGHDISVMQVCMHIPCKYTP